MEAFKLLVAVGKGRQKPREQLNMCITTIRQTADKAHENWIEEVQNDLDQADAAESSANAC